MKMVFFAKCCVKAKNAVVPASTMAKKGFSLAAQILWLSVVVSAVGTVSVVLSFSAFPR